jgi:hypothetical protein
LEPIDAVLNIHINYVIPGLDPGTSWRRLTGGLQAEVLMPSAQFLKGGTRIKSGYDGKRGATEAKGMTEKKERRI